MNAWIKTSVICGVLSFTAPVQAKTLLLCVYDLIGAGGDTMALAKDYALQAKQWGVEIEPKSYTKVSDVVAAFDSKQCDGIAADSFATKKYNNFAGTIGATGAIPDYAVAQKTLQAMASPKLASRLQSKNYEVMGFMPFGLVYLVSKDRSTNNIQSLNGKRYGVLSIDPTQARMAKRVGMKPIDMSYDDISPRFKRGDFDIIPSPLVAYEPLEFGKVIGSSGGIVDYPVAFVSMNFIFRKDDIPADLGQRSRQWFAQKAPTMIKTVQSWDSKVPKSVFIPVLDIDKAGYDMLLSQMRKEFIKAGTYDSVMLNIITRLRCNSEPKFVECRKH